MSISPHRDEPTTVSPSQRAAVEYELNSILKSAHFSGSKRCQEFLEFIVRQKLDGNFESLNERFLGMEIFGRPIDYETGTDSIVRVRANDVRRRLVLYYLDHPLASNVTIHLASGTYVPEFHWLQQVSPPAAHAASIEHLPADLAIAHDFPEASSPDLHHAASSTQAHSAHWPRLIGAIAIALVVGCCAGWWLKQRAVERMLYPWRFSPAMNSLWTGILNNNHATDVVLSDASFQLLQDIGKKTFTLNEYLNRSYIGPVPALNSPMDIQAALHQISTKNFGNSSEYRLAQRILALDPMGNEIHIYNARDYSSSLVTQDNVILIGSQYTNPWQRLFNSALTFVAEDPGKDKPGLIINVHPRPGEPPSYTPTDSVGYCVVAYLPNPGTSGTVLLIEGSSSEATEAGGDFLLSEDQLAAFEKQLHSTKIPYFEVLLKTSQARGTPIAATVAAYRSYPNQH